MKKNLILGLLNYYTFYDVKKFLKSLKESPFNGELSLFLGAGTSPLSKKKFIEYGVNILNFNNITQLPEGNLAAKEFNFPQPTTHNNYRWYLYYDFLLRNHEKYDYVLLTDVKDVYFQRDPFDFPLTDGLICVLEGKTKTIRQDTVYNGPWVEYVYGKEALNEIGDEYISCCGTVYGKVDVIINYIKMMLQEFGKLSEAKMTLDQGIHNYLLYKKHLPVTNILPNEDGVVLTISNESGYLIGQDGKIKAKNGRTYNVVHQFDRIPELVKLTDGLYRKTGALNYLTRKFYKLDLFIHRIFLKMRIR